MASRSQRGRRAAATAPTEPRSERRVALLDNRIVRALVAHQHRTAAGLLGLLVLVYLWPVLLGGDILAPAALLGLVAPWRAVASPHIGAYINPELGDVPYSYYPWDLLARELIRSGTFPAWNPYAFGGTQLFANPELAWLSPFSLPLWTLPLDDGLAVAAALKLWAAGFGTYLLVRELRLGFWPGIVAGIAFTLCTFNVVWLTYGVFVSVAAMLPWGLWLTERALRRGSPGAGLGLVAVVAVAQAGGHPGTQLHVLAGIALYALVRAATLSDAARRERRRGLALVGAGLALGTMLAAVVLLPAQQAASGTVGAAVRMHGSPGFPGSSMPASVIRTALFPHWWGDGYVVAPERPAVPFRERAFYAGSATLVLALVALAMPGAWRRKAPFAVLGALGVAVALRAPGLHELVINAPLFERVQNQRILLWFLLAASVLAAFGVEAALDAKRDQRRTWAVVALAVAVAFVALATTPLGDGALDPAVRHFLDRTEFAPTAAFALASIAWWLVGVGALAAVLLLARARPGARRVAGALIALVVALDLLHFAHGYNRMGPASVVIPPRPPAMAWLQQHERGARIAAVEPAAPADTPTLYGLHDVRGYDVPQPTFRFFNLMRVGSVNVDPWALLELTPTSPQVLGVLGTRYILVDPAMRVAVPKLSVAYRGRDATIYENELAAPRAFVPRSVRVATDAPEELAMIGEVGFDPRTDATLRAPEIDGPPPPGQAAGTATVVRESNASVVLRATLPRRGLVVLDDTWAPGWSVRVDGRPAQALQANAVLRAVVVPPGSHTIEWSYRVPGMRLGAALSGVALLVALAWAGALARSRRARRRAAPDG